MFTTTTSQSKPASRYRLIALVLGVCALAIPASASASYGSAPGSPPDPSGAPASDAVSENSGLVIPDHNALNESLGPVSRSPGVTGVEAPPIPPAGVSPVSSDGFDWADAALGAGVAMALVALGGAALLTARRRTTVSPSASAAS